MNKEINSQKDIDAIREQIRGHIRSGMKTSEITAKFKFPLEVIKEVKSEELEREKQLARDKVKEDQNRHMQYKREKHHRAFLERMGQNADAVSQNENMEVKKIPDASAEKEKVVGAPAQEINTDQGNTEGAEGAQSSHSSEAT